MTKIIQLWSNNGTLGITVYSPNERGEYEKTWRNDNMGEGSGAVSFLTGNVNGNDRTDIIQLWSNKGQLGITVYSPNERGEYEKTWRNDDMGEGSGAVSFLTGDVNGNGQTDIIQLWDNKDNLGMTVYSANRFGQYQKAWRSPNMGEGSTSGSWLW